MMQYRLGVLGGMGPQATNTFYQFVIDRTDAQTDQEHVNALILSDSEMPDRTSAILSGGEAHLMLPVNDGCDGAEPDPESMYF